MATKKKQSEPIATLHDGCSDLAPEAQELPRLIPGLRPLPQRPQAAAKQSMTPDELAAFTAWLERVAAESAQWPLPKGVGTK